MPRDHFLNNAAWHVYARTATAKTARRRAILGNLLAGALTTLGFLAVIIRIWTVTP